MHLQRVGVVESLAVRSTLNGPLRARSKGLLLRFPSIPRRIGCVKAEEYFLYSTEAGRILANQGGTVSFMLALDMYCRGWVFCFIFSTCEIAISQVGDGRTNIATCGDGLPMVALVCFEDK